MGLYSCCDRFVDRDMFMRYRGGGIGHKYMREVESKYENMAIERVHGSSHPKPPHNSANNDTVMSRLAGSGPIQLGGSQENGDEDRGKQSWGESDSDDEDYVPPVEGSSDDDDSTDASGDYLDDDDRLVDSEADFDEVGSDGGYDSHGMADP